MKTIVNKIPGLIKSAFDGDKKQIEKNALSLIKAIKKDYPNVAQDISEIIYYSSMSHMDTRSVDMSLLPLDQDNKFSLLKSEINADEDFPILEQNILNRLKDFILERSKIKEFLDEGIVPSNSMLLVGKPGVGKTLTAKWIASELELPLLTVDLASTISSYLGKSGQNIKAIFDYSKSKNVVLFLDEIDAIAKKRDDLTDLGELKRLVNVLLKEIEESPSSLIIIAATNHPELLDKALWRRFDMILELPLPNEKYRKELLVKYLNGYAPLLNAKMIDFIANHTEGKNASDIKKMAEHIIRKKIIHSEYDLDFIALRELFNIVNTEEKSSKESIVKEISLLFPKLKQSMIAEITGISVSTVSRYIKK